MADFSYMFFSALFLICSVQTSTVNTREPYIEVTQPSFLDLFKHNSSKSQEFDLAFIMDTTGSMSSYLESARQNIQEIVAEIETTSQSDVRLALIEYRDHEPEEKSFVTRKHDFTYYVSRMKSWLNAATASGGGDRPEALADALHEATKLTWRPKATKICVIISDAPPHGLVPSEDNYFPYGSPNGHDPMKIARVLAHQGVTLYIIGCEPAIVPYKDFFMALAYLTGGQYVPLKVPRLLVNAISGGAKEEISLRKFEKDVQQELHWAAENVGYIDKQKIAASLFQKLSKSGATAMQLVRNDKPLEGPSDAAKSLAESTSMAEVRKKFKQREMPMPPLRHLTSRPFSRFDPSFRSSRASRGFGRRGFGMTGRAMGRPWRFESDLSDYVNYDTFRTVKSRITINQINRLVEKETSKIFMI